MTYSELFKLYELKGRLRGRMVCLDNDLNSIGNLIPKLESLSYRAHFEGQLVALKRWRNETARLLEEVCRIIKEAENAEEQDDLPF